MAVRIIALGMSHRRHASPSLPTATLTATTAARHHHHPRSFYRHRQVPPPCFIAGFTCNLASSTSSPPYIASSHHRRHAPSPFLHRHRPDQTPLVDRWPTRLRRFCPMRGAVFFSTCASIGDKGLSGRNRWCMFLLNFQAPVVWLGI